MGLLLDNGFSNYRSAFFPFISVGSLKGTKLWIVQVFEPGPNRFSSLPADFIQAKLMF